ncbi:uncharacterized protein LOC117678903 [Pantherophis guttatus]|uniref:Uncharacterized protein LOC117678903 n=1 Tax=Pantherophis guttatus TaxID=94885 RepID=A0A6P9DYZ3_PANGU|nr:uncharacterized protein LOC117678903 [Pantherophis guttatus]
MPSPLARPTADGLVPTPLPPGRGAPREERQRLPLPASAAAPPSGRGGGRGVVAGRGLRRLGNLAEGFECWGATPSLRKYPKRLQKGQPAEFCRRSVIFGVLEELLQQKGWKKSEISYPRIFYLFPGLEDFFPQQLLKCVWQNLQFLSFAGAESHHGLKAFSVKKGERTVWKLTACKNPLSQGWKSAKSPASILDFCTVHLELRI